MIVIAITEQTLPPGTIDRWTENDAILPSQLFADVAALGDPERRLRLAILKDAVRYFQRHLDTTDRRERVLYEDAVDWVSSPDRSEPFSFENVCDALRLNPEYVRRGLRRWRETARTARRPVNEPTGHGGRHGGRRTHAERRAA